MNLKRLTQEANPLFDSCEDNVRRWYELLIDTFYTKVYKEKKLIPKKSPREIFPIYFHNKGLERIKLNKILRDKEVISKLPLQLQKLEPPAIVYKLSPTIRNKIFNYKKTVESIDINDKITYGTNIPYCDCADSPFVDSDHGHIITGDLRLIENNHLRKLLSKGPNYREPKRINFRKCRDVIEQGLQTYSDTLLSKFDLQENDILAWKNEVLQKVERKTASLKHKVKYHEVKPVLENAEVLEYLQVLQSRFVIVPIDKAANNVSFVCKRYYVEVILGEIGIIGEGNQTYVNSKFSKEEIVDINVDYSKILNVDVCDREKDLPIMYWTPKKHKKPTGKRFIIASKQCSTKKISKAVSHVFKLIYNQVENFHLKAKFLSNYNKFWIIQNSDPVLESITRINKKNNAKSISTFDFSTLYTKLPHDKLVNELSKIIDFVFDAGSSKYIIVSPHGKVYWSKHRHKSSICFSRSSLKKTLRHLIENCYFCVGITIMRQAIGIPMGIDPAPFWANLFLYQYEHRYMDILIAQDRVAARHFHSTKRFIDDLCALNDGNLFERVYKEIYPEELELKLEHSGNHGTFLNLDITIKNGKFIYKLFDKRDAFPFSIVRMPYLDSNIPESIFYSSLVGEFLRIARSTLLKLDFTNDARKLVQRMQKQGADKIKIRQNLYKIISRHLSDFTRFGTPSKELIEELLQ